MSCGSGRIKRPFLCPARPTVPQQPIYRSTTLGTEDKNSNPQKRCTLKCRISAMCWWAQKFLCPCPCVPSHVPGPTAALHVRQRNLDPRPPYIHHACYSALASVQGLLSSYSSCFSAFATHASHSAGSDAAAAGLRQKPRKIPSPPCCIQVRALVAPVCACHMMLG